MIFGITLTERGLEMFAYERHQRIKQILYEKKTIDVVYLSRYFGVSETTIRRDLDKLEQQNFLEKTYGGAVLNETILPKSYAEIQDDRRANDEKTVASIAAQLIDSGEAIFLSGGAICEYIAGQLGSYTGLTVVTNDLEVACRLRASDMRPVVVGGQAQDGGSQLLGELAEVCLQHIFVNKAFICVQGVHIKAGFTASSIDLSLFYKKIAGVANEMIMMADAGKFGYSALSRIGPLTMASKIVTNQNIDDAFKQYCFENSIKLYTTFEF